MGRLSWMPGATKADQTRAAGEMWGARDELNAFLRSMLT